MKKLQVPLAVILLRGFLYTQKNLQWQKNGVKKITLTASLFFLIAVNVSSQVLYGTTNLGGSQGAGVINTYDLATNTLSAIKSFETPETHPYSTHLLQASDGNLYGMTSGGGALGEGVIFSYNPLTAVYKKLKDFDGKNGGFPVGSLMQASDGKLYGMTASSVGGMGVIFSLDPLTEVYTKLLDFNTSNGAGPLGSLIQASDGKLYGMTTRGGVNDEGVIFSFDHGC